MESGLVRNTYARYHICLMRVFSLSGTTCVSIIIQYLVYHYITATAVYLLQRVYLS